MKHLVFLILSLCILSCSSKKSDSTNTQQTENKESVWNILYYLDEFQEQTNEPYVIGDFKGSFSNSATTDDELKVSVLVDSTSVRFQFYEYGSHLIKDTGYIKIRYKKQDGTTDELSLHNTEDGYLEIFDSNRWDFQWYTYDDVKKLRDLFIQNHQIKFSCNNTDDGSKYNFEVNTEGLKDALDKANIPVEMPPYPGKR